AETGNPDQTHASSVSSYAISKTGTLTPITTALPTFQDAACWLVTAGRFAYIANAASATITGVRVSRHGKGALLNEDGVRATTGAGAIDLALSPDHNFLFSLGSRSHTISTFAPGANGGLTALQVFSDVPAAAAGLVAR